MLKERGVRGERGDLKLGITVAIGGAAVADKVMGDRGQRGGDRAGRFVLAAVSNKGDDNAMKDVDREPSVLFVDPAAQNGRLFGAFGPFLALLRRLCHTLLVIRHHLRAPVNCLLLARLPVDLETYQTVGVALCSEALGVGADDEGDAGEGAVERHLLVGHGGDGVELTAGEEVLQLGLCVYGGRRRGREVRIRLEMRRRICLIHVCMYIPCSSPSGLRWTTG